MAVFFRFVYDVLFPYAREHGPQFIRDHWNDPDVERARAEFDEENLADLPDGAPPSDSPDGLARYYLWLMEHDRKSTPLKAIQGLVWREGYADGDLQSEVFSDVPAALHRWTESGLRIAIYSSG